MKRGKPFKPGNKLGRGRPPGSRNKKSLLPQEVLSEYGDRLIRKALHVALKGDSAMLRMFLGHLLPKQAEPAVKVGPLRFGTAEELNQGLNRVMELVAAGQLNLSAAKDITDMIETRRRVIDTKELEGRVRLLEDAHRDEELKVQQLQEKHGIHNIGDLSLPMQT